jgi:tripartite ATP-independent transporter DctM subunit
MELWLFTLILFSVMVLCLVLGLPIAFSLSGIAVLFTLILMGPKGLMGIPSYLYSEGMSWILLAIPLFVFMANLLEVSGIAEDLYNMMYKWIGGIPGGFASGTIIICAIFAAMAGISGVAVVTMGLIAIPSMLKRNYDKQLVVGTVAAGGALGILIPPSVIAIIYGSITEASVGKLFMGGVVPGIILATAFIVYITIRSVFQPRLAPPLKEKFTWSEKISSLRAVMLPFILILLVLGTIYAGIVTPTEAAGIGAFGSIICCLFKGRLTWNNVSAAARQTLRITTMVIWIIFGAVCFTFVYTIGGASEFMMDLVSELPISPMGIIWIMMIIYFFLGMFMDPAGQAMITIPIFVPIVEALGFDIIWFGILWILNCEMDYLTPPFGFNLFYLKGIVPPEITMMDIYRSIVPFVALQFLVMVLVMYFPEIALWLPNKMTFQGG